jgi:hypothetical protein
MLGSGTALAAPIDCVSGALCTGTEEADLISGTTEDDHILALGGNDEIKARKGSDRINAGAGEDASNGGSGNDTYKFEDGWGQDTVAADATGKDTINFRPLSAGLEMALEDGHPTIQRGATDGTNTLALAGNFVE